MPNIRMTITKLVAISKNVIVINQTFSVFKNAMVT